MSKQIVILLTNKNSKTIIWSMSEYTLQEFCDERSQQAAADIIGVTQGAVWQMLEANREIYIQVPETGDPTFYEVKRKAKRSHVGAKAPKG